MGEKGTVCFAESTNISRIHIGGHRKRLQVLSSQPRSLDKQKYLISLLAGRGILAGDPNKETCSTKHFRQSGSAKKKKEPNLIVLQNFDVKGTLKHPSRALSHRLIYSPTFLVTRIFSSSITSFASSAPFTLSISMVLSISEIQSTISTLWISCPGSLFSVLLWFLFEAFSVSTIQKNNLLRSH